MWNAFHIYERGFRIYGRLFHIHDRNKTKKFLETPCSMIVISIEPQSGGFISLNKSVRDVADH